MKWLLLMLSLPVLAAPTTQPAFIIGVWQMDVNKAADWKALGVNTAWGEVDYGGTMSKATYEQKLIDRETFFITSPSVTYVAEAKQPYRIGFAQRDEPDVGNHQGKPGWTLAEMKEKYQAIKTTGMPMYATFGSFDNEWYDGRKVRLDNGQLRPFYHAAQDGGYFAQTDIVGWDYYLWTTGRPDMFFIHERLMNRVRDWGDKPMIVFIETSTQGKNLPYTVSNFEANVWHTVLYCARNKIKLAGICYFTHKVYPGWTSFDNTAPDVKASMKLINQRLTDYAAGRTSPLPTTQPSTTQPATRPVTGVTVKFEDGTSQHVGAP